MIRSLNQIEQTTRKAVRGAGLPWGLAEDAGRAVRWLHTYGVNGVSALARLLARQDYANAKALTPAALSGQWRAPGGVLDPLLTGASLSDSFATAAPIQTATIAHPLLAAGFIGTTAETKNHAFTLTWPNARLCRRQDALWLEGAQPDIETEIAEFLCCRQSADEHEVNGPPRARQIAEATVESTAWKHLEQYAHRTYVEATDASRMSGAGAGLNDND